MTASTLVVVASKTFTTQETMANAAAAREWGATAFYAVTSNLQAAKAFGAREILPMWDWVGGRFSVWSAAGFAAMCAIGPEAFREFLDGGKDIDAHFAQAPLEKNVPVLMGLSCLFTKQHYLVDIPAGAMLGWLVFVMLSGGVT